MKKTQNCFVNLIFGWWNDFSFLLFWKNWIFMFFDISSLSFEYNMIIMQNVHWLNVYQHIRKKLSNNKIIFDFVQKSMYDEETHGRYHNEQWIQVRNILNNVNVKISHKNKKALNLIFENESKPFIKINLHQFEISYWD